MWACLLALQANEADLSGPWPKEDQGKVPAEVQNQWEEARAHLFFKVTRTRAVGMVVWLMA